MSLNKLAFVEKAHWELHLKAAQKEYPDNKDISSYLTSKMQLPNIKHPSYIHDWLEHPEMRKEIEAWNG